MQALAQDGMAPRWLAKIDSKGRPLVCVAIQLAFGLLAFVQEAKHGQTAFTWLLALSGLSYFFVWGSICFAHIRFRHAWKVQGHSLDELPFKSMFGIWGSWCGFGIACLSIIATFYISLFVSSLSSLFYPIPGQG